MANQPKAALPVDPDVATPRPSVLTNSLLVSKVALLPILEQRTLLFALGNRLPIDDLV
jgi:hypothetical protein